MANNESIPLTITENNLRISLDEQSGSPYYVGARAYVTQLEDGATITVIDKEGTTTASVYNGQDGATGATGATGANGADGRDGQDGADGYSPTATVSKVGDTATITITDVNGTTTASVSDGDAGIFFAEFGTTTYAETKAAWDAGKNIICVAWDGSLVYVMPLVEYDTGGNVFHFCAEWNQAEYRATLSEYEDWDGNGYSIAQVQADWSEADSDSPAYINNKPTIPTVNNATLTIQKNGTTVNTFTANASSNVTANITVPTSAADVSAIPTSAKGAASGVCPLDANGKVDASYLPVYNGGVS